MNTKGRIAQDYCNLVIAKQTTKLTVKEICTYCQISRTTFYKYFKDTYDIIEYIFVKDCVDPLKHLMETDIQKRYLTLNWYVSFYKNKDFYLIAIKSEGQNSFFETIISQLESNNIQFFSKLWKEKEEYSTQDIAYLSYKLAATQAMLLKKWIEEGMVISPEKMTDYFLHNTTHG